MSNSYWTRGEVARLGVEIFDASGLAADPGALRCIVRSPTGTVSTATYGDVAGPVRDAAGVYRLDVPLGAAGIWAWRWEADAPYAGAAEGELFVRGSRF